MSECCAHDYSNNTTQHTIAQFTSHGEHGLACQSNKWSTLASVVLLPVREEAISARVFLLANFTLERLDPSVHVRVRNKLLAAWKALLAHKAVESKHPSSRNSCIKLAAADLTGRRENHVRWSEAEPLDARVLALNVAVVADVAADKAWC
jgi:hypothetical protein